MQMIKVESLRLIRENQKERCKAYQSKVKKVQEEKQKEGKQNEF